MLFDYKECKMCAIQMVYQDTTLATKDKVVFRKYVEKLHSCILAEGFLKL